MFVIAGRQTPRRGTPSTPKSRQDDATPNKTPKSACMFALLFTPILCTFVAGVFLRQKCGYFVRSLLVFFLTPKTRLFWTFVARVFLRQKRGYFGRSLLVFFTPKTRLFCMFVVRVF